MEVDIDSVIELVHDVDSHPEVLLRPQKKDAQMNNVLQRMYMFTMHHDVNKTSDILPELVLEDMDQEQIWQQLDIKNNHAISNYLSQVACVAALHEIKLSIQVENKEDVSMTKTAKKKKDNPVKKNVIKAKNVKESSTDQSNDTGRGGDRFFDLDEMKKFLDLEDAKAGMNGKTDSGQIDFFQEMDNENDDIKYNDFYDDDNENNVSYNDMNNDEDSDVEENESIVNEDDNDNDNDNDNDDVNDNDDSDLEETDDDDQSEENGLQKSSYEERQDRRQKQISVHESQMLDEKPWQLKGEILAGGRPQNSLLEEVLEFESSVRPAPVITEETTLKLEDIIRQRIKDQAWDDVELKIREKLVAPEYRKQIVLDQEKSKMSLSKIYETEYQNEKDKQNVQNIESVEKNPEIEKIEQNMNNLLDKLNSLFHFYFTPTPAMPEPRIITNTPALQMEDALPVAVSDATLLAPEEVFKKNKKSFLGKSERTSTDKNRDRRQKKLKQKAIMKRSVKQSTNLKHMSKTNKSKVPTKSSKRVEMINHDDVKQPKSSKQFFARMQENSISNGSKKVVKQKTQRAKSVKL